MTSDGMSTSRMISVYSRLGIVEMCLLVMIAIFPSLAVGLVGSPFFHLPEIRSVPQLVLISGSTGTGKSTFGMSIALNQGILRCISTDSIRQILRTVQSDAALHRSSFMGTGNAIDQWRECCQVLDEAIFSLVQDAAKRRSSLVIEGVHVVPRNNLLDYWRERGGVAMGCVMTISNEDDHRQLILKRARASNNEFKEHNDPKMKNFHRIRAIQREMSNMGGLAGWLEVEQQVQLDPVEQVQEELNERIRLMHQESGEPRV